MYPEAPAGPAASGSDEDGIRDVVTQGDEYLRPRQEQAKDRALDPAEASGSSTPVTTTSHPPTPNPSKETP